jgi:hypothetical protein
LYIVMPQHFDAHQRSINVLGWCVFREYKFVVRAQQRCAFRLDHALDTLREVRAKLRDCAPTSIIPLYLMPPWRLSPAISVVPKHRIAYPEHDHGIPHHNDSIIWLNRLSNMLTPYAKASSELWQLSQTLIAERNRKPQARLTSLP